MLLMAMYADTCILLPLFFRDASTGAALGWLEANGSKTILHSELRAGDALHLAACTRLSATLCTADGTLARAADNAGVTVQQVA